LRAVEVERIAHLAGDFAHAVFDHAADVLVGAIRRRSVLGGRRRSLRGGELLGVAERAFLGFVLLASRLLILGRALGRDHLLVG